MKIEVDRETATLYFLLAESRIVESGELEPGVILDYGKDDRVVGVAFLGVSARASEDQLSSIQFQPS